jgi:hypothetical protein
MVQWIYDLVTRKLDKAKRSLSTERTAETGSFTTYVSTEDIIERSGVWAWLAKRAMRSQMKRKMGLA